MDSTKSSSGRPDVYQIVTDQVINLLGNGVIPWQKPWTDAGMPRNALSKRAYRGINLWLLLSLNYEQNLFLTWEQIKKLGGSVKKDEKGQVVVYWKTPPKKEDATEEEKKAAPILRYYKVFNIAQCRDLPETLIEPLPGNTEEANPIPECEAVIHNMPQCPEIKHKWPEAAYHITEDFINMPKKKSFKNPELYYATLFHELVHSTGHEKRLNRKSITEMAEFGSDTYSQEELIAEMGSAYLSSYAGIGQKSLDNTVAYIQGWLNKLKDDKRFIIQASGQAQKAVDFILRLDQVVEEVKEEAEHLEIPAE